jgi:hypothetical protein
MPHVRKASHCYGMYSTTQFFEPQGNSLLFCVPPNRVQAAEPFLDSSLK